MHVAIVAGKYDGCGVSTYLFELKSAINKYVGTCDYYVYDCPSYFTDADYAFMKKLNVNLITRKDSKILDNYDVVFAGYHVVRSQVTEEEVRGYYDMLEYDISKPKKVLIFNEHRPSSIIKHYAGNTIDDYCLKNSFILSFDYIMQFGENITSAVFLKDLIGEYEYMKRFIPLYLLYEFDDSKSNWVKASDKLRCIEYIGRPALFKDAHRLIRMNNYLQDAKFVVEMRGLGNKSTVENLPDFVYEFNGKELDKSKLSKVTYWANTENAYEMLNVPFEQRNRKIYCYGSYNRYEIYNHLNNAMFACDFFNLPHIEDYAGQTIEYCMCEFIDNGIIPVLDSSFSKNCKLLKNAKLTNITIYDLPMGIYVSKDLSDIDNCMNKLKQLADSAKLYDAFRNECIEYWKMHCNPEAIVKNIFYRIYA